MTEERKQILDMLVAGQITADEADRLIGALNGAPPTATATAPPAKAMPKYLRVMVDAQKEGRDGPAKINVRVPLVLLRSGVRLASLIPGPAQEQVNRALREQGLSFDLSQIKPENLDEFIEQLQDFSIDVDKKDADVKIRFFIE